MSDLPPETWVLPDGRAFTVNDPFYMASCNKCGWVGSSEECGTDWDLGLGDSDVYCPKCGARGVDGGRVAETAVLVSGDQA